MELILKYDMANVYDYYSQVIEFKLKKNRE